MNLTDFRAFTARLQANLESHHNVLGLVALGSMAERGRTPDAWSDHDFFVITVPQVQEHYRQDHSWLPDAENIVLHIRETAHGLKVLYKNGHLLEFAIFDEAELQNARLNDYRVLFDRSSIGATLAHLEQVSHQESQKEDSHRAFELFLSLLLVGSGRAARGEVLSGHAFIKQYALRNLLLTLTRYLPSERLARLDNLDPFRRFELVYPEYGAELNQLLLLPPIQCAQALLDFANRNLAPLKTDYPHEAAQVIADYLAAQVARTV